MRQSFGDLVRVVPLAGLFLVFGLELTTMMILRYMPSLLPRAMRLEVVPAAQKLGVAPTAEDARIGAAKLVPGAAARARFDAICYPEVIDTNQQTWLSAAGGWRTALVGR